MLYPRVALCMRFGVVRQERRTPTRGRPVTGGADQRREYASQLLGRTDALEQVDLFVSEIPSGPTTLMITGEHGMGRTSLWRYALVAARASDYRVLAIRVTEEDSRAAGTGVRDLFADSPGAFTADDASATPGFDAGRQTLTGLRQLSADRPLLLAVDDGQWLDLVSANALRFGLQRLTEQPVGMVSTLATVVPGIGMSLGLRYGRHVHLGPLPVSMVRAVLARSIPAVSRPELTRAYELTGGNPGLALELVRSWRCDQPIAGGTGRLAELSADTVTVLRTLALAGPATVGVIASAAAVDDFADRVAEAVAAGVVTVEDDLTMRFVDRPSAQLALAGMYPLDRCAVHARLADLDDDPAGRARHRALATVLPDEDIAADTERAAAWCADRGQSELAAELAGHAVRLTPSTESGAAARRALAEIDHRAAAGETARAIDLADRLLGRLPTGPRRAQVLAERVILDFGESQNFLRQALADVGDDESLRTRILDLIGWQYGLYQGRLAEGVQFSRQALELARSQNDSEVVALAGATLASTLSLTGHPHEELFAQAIEAAAALRLSPLGRWPMVFWARHLLWSGGLAQARRIFVRMEKDALARGSEFQRPYRLHDLAVTDVAAGDLPVARAEAETGIEAARDAGNEQAVSWLAHPLGLAAALQGDAPTAHRCADLLARWGAANDEPPRQTMADEVLGNLAATAGDWGTALEHFEAMVRRLDAMGYQHPGARPGLPLAIEAAVMVREDSAARQFTGRLASQVSELRAPLPDALLLAARGQVASANGSDEDAADQLGRAAEDLDRLGYRLQAARARLALARAMVRAGRRTAARTAADLAAATFTAAGAAPWAAAAEELRTRAVAGPRSGTLTAAESQIAGLVAAGRMNREIAAALFVSTSTVEAHLTRIYRKLQLRHRTDLATWVRQSQPPNGH